MFTVALRAHCGFSRLAPPSLACLPGVARVAMCALRLPPHRNPTGALRALGVLLDAITAARSGASRLDQVYSDVGELLGALLGVLER